MTIIIYSFNIKKCTNTLQIMRVNLFGTLIGSQDMFFEIGFLIRLLRTNLKAVNPYFIFLFTHRKIVLTILCTLIQSKSTTMKTIQNSRNTTH